MAAEGRSLSSGISIPQWMKTKINDHRLDINQSAFSPTELDDTFLYIHLPRASSEPVEQTTTKQISIVESKPSTPATAPVTSSAAAAKPDFTKHTPPCQKFIPETSKRHIQSNVQYQQKPIKIKSNGTDDGFKGEAAACGSSVVKVAHQMVSGKGFRAFGVNNSDQDDNTSECPKGFDPALRRGSKSLPSSPLTSPNSSPKSKRRLQNKYFTGAFSDNAEKYQGSWILSNLLGKRSLSQSVGMIAEESKEELMQGVSESSLDSNMSRSTKQIFKPKPSEFREMNFWSPTSM